MPISITPGMSASNAAGVSYSEGSAPVSLPAATPGQSTIKITPGMSVDPQHAQYEEAPPSALMQTAHNVLAPITGLVDVAANQASQFMAMGNPLQAVGNVVGSVGNEVVRQLSQDGPIATIENAGDWALSKLAGVTDPSIHAPLDMQRIGDTITQNIEAQTLPLQTAQGEQLTGALSDTMGAIPKAIDATDDLTGSNLKRNFPSIYAVLQTAGELAPYAVIGAGVHAGLPKTVDNPLLSSNEMAKHLPEQEITIQPESVSAEIPNATRTIEVAPDMSGIAASVAEMVTSPILSKTEQAAKAVERISQIQADLDRMNIDPTTASPELLAEAGKLQAVKERLQKSYDNVSEELGGESSALDQPAQDTIQIPKENYVANTEVVQGALDHLSNPDVGDSTVYQSPSLLAHGNFVEDLLQSSGLKNKVALLDRKDLGAGEGGTTDPILKQLSDRLDETGNYGVVKRLQDGSYAAVLNTDAIAKGGGAAKARLVEVATHEAFGHIVVDERYHSADIETQGALQKDFERYSKLSPEEATKAFYPIKTGEVAIGVPEGLGDSHFKEWFVNGITKWATSEAEPVGLANKWFAKLAAVFNKAFSKEGASQTPESIRNWMNSIFDTRRLRDKVEAPVEVKPSIEPHSPVKSLSKAKQLEKLKSVVSKDDLAPYEIGKVEGKDQSTLGVYRKGTNGEKILLDTFSSSSRTSARREAELFSYAHALASRNLAEPISSSTARVEYYKKALADFKPQLEAWAKDNQQSFEQTWLNFLGDAASFTDKISNKDMLLQMSEPGRKIFNRLQQAAEHNPEGLKKAILYEKRVVPADVQELVKAEPILKEEIAEAPVKVEESPKVEPQPIDTVQNSNLNFEDRVKGKAMETVEALNKVGSKVNLERIQSSVLEKLGLSGKDSRDAKALIKDNYEELKAGKAKEVDSEIEQHLSEGKVPDDVSLEEAAAYMDGLEDMAVRRKKSGPITGPLYEKVAKAKKKGLDLSPGQISEKIKKRLAKETEFVDQTSKLEAEAKRQNVSLTELLRAVGKDKDGNPMSEDTIAKVLRKYQRLAKTIFTDTEHIIRLGRELGLVDGDTGVQGLEAFVKSVFPKAQGPLKQLTITGRDILMKHMQDAWFAKEGKAFDFRQFKSMRELQADQIAAMSQRTGWEKFTHGVTYFMNTAADELNTTPAGSALVQLIKNKIATENALYLRDYQKRLNELATLVTDPQDREHILNVYEGRETARNKIFQGGADLLKEIYTSYGTEMERLGVRVQYKGGYSTDFKFDPTVSHYPHMWEPGAFDKPSEEMINSLIVSGNAVDSKQARAIISQFGSRQTRLAAPRFANIEMAREVQMEGYIKDPIKVTSMYLNRGASRLAILREFGQAPETRLAQLAWDHFQQSGDPDQLNFAVKVINSITGVAVHEPLMKRALDIVGVAEFTAMASALQHAALIQPSIISNLAVTAGWKNTAKGFYRYIKADPRKASMSKEWADVLGASGRSVGKELMDQLGSNTNLQTRADKLLNFWKVTSVDRWLRDASSLVGQLHVNEMVERAINLNDKKAHLELRRLGLEAGKFKEALDAGDDSLVEDYIKKGSYAFSQRTNLLTDPLSRPLWQMEKTSWGGLLTLFGRFGFLQHHFLKGLIQDGKAVSGIAGQAEQLGKYLAYATTVGIPIYTARQLAKGVNPVEDFAEKGLFGFMFGALQSGGGLGLFMDAAGNALNEIATGAQSTVNERFGGPVASLGKETATGIGKILHGDITNAQALRLLMRAGIVTIAGKAPEKFIPVAGALGIARPMIERALADKQQPNSMFK